ncbi:MAG TPA: hypothetical protein VNZ45_10475 [Bacteroidia bacterium]|jgi:hypothetical protein|nr:hypothetical protein [Bacteroidia bacterium]
MRAAESSFVKDYNGSFQVKPLKNFNAILNSTEKSDEKYLLSFFEIFKNRVAGEKMFAYLHRLGLVVKKNNEKYVFTPKTRSSVLPIVCLYKTLNEKGYLKRMTQTEAGYYFCTAFGKNIHNIRMFYADQLDACTRYNEYFFHIPNHSDFISC